MGKNTYERMGKKVKIGVWFIGESRRKKKDELKWCELMEWGIHTWEWFNS